MPLSHVFQRWETVFPKDQVASRYKIVIFAASSHALFCDKFLESDPIHKIILRVGKIRVGKMNW